MRIAFTLIDSASWTGGYNYLLNLFRSVREHQPDQLRPVLFCGVDATESDLQPFQAMSDVEIIRSSRFNSQTQSNRLLKSLLLGCDADALRIFREYQIDVVFENACFYGWRFPIPTIAWMPDFQHRHLREQFKFSAYWRRELGFRAQVASHRIIMLSSQDARRDCERFYPGAIGHTSVVRFAAPIPADLIEQAPQQVLTEYDLPSKFFYLPNQFWKHKNHRIVIEALGLLKQQRQSIVVVASGNPIDSRHPEHLARLNDRIESLGLRDNFRMLGLIPRRHVISLMRTCVALINPSHFEGWSSTVEEARTLSVSMLLSDIGVHREQMEDAALYFDPDDAVSLAAKLQELNLQKSRLPAVTETMTHEDPIRRFASDFLSVAEMAVHRPDLKGER